MQCSNTGLKQILNHAESKKHSDLAAVQFGKSQQHFLNPVQYQVQIIHH